MPGKRKMCGKGLHDLTQPGSRVQAGKSDRCKECWNDYQRESYKQGVRAKKILRELEKLQGEL